MLSFNTYKCLKCGKVYVHRSGGVILDMKSPKCPICGSGLYIPWFSNGKEK